MKQPIVKQSIEEKLDDIHRKLHCTYYSMGRIEEELSYIRFKIADQKPEKMIQLEANIEWHVKKVQQLEELLCQSLIATSAGSSGEQ